MADLFHELAPVEAIAQLSRLAPVYFETYLTGWTKEGVQDLVDRCRREEWPYYKDARVRQLDRLMAELIAVDRARVSAAFQGRGHEYVSAVLQGESLRAVQQVTGVSLLELERITMGFAPGDLEELRKRVELQEWAETPLEHHPRLYRMARDMQR